MCGGGFGCGFLGVFWVVFGCESAVVCVDGGVFFFFLRRVCGGGGGVWVFWCLGRPEGGVGWG